MSKKTNRLLALLLCAVMVFSVIALSACSKDEPKETTPVPGSSQGDETQAPDPNADPYPDQDFDGYGFLAYEVAFDLSTYINNFTPNEDAATVIDQAIFTRNAEVEKKLNITISSEAKKASSTTGSAEGYSYLLQLRRSGDAVYDVATLPAYDVAKVAYSDGLYDMNHVSTLDLERSCWDQQAVKDLEIKGMQFFTTGDFNLDCFNATVVITFNKELAKQYNVNDLYQLVDEGKWTMDKWMEYTELVSDDLDGDSFYSNKDLYGALLWDDSIYAAVHSAGEHCAIVNDDGDLELTLGTERVVSVFQDYVDFSKKNCVLRWQQDFDLTTKTRKNNPGSTNGRDMFLNNQGLFLITAISTTTRYFRDMDTDYGILPMFKYDDTQDRYYNNVAPYSSRFMCLPFNQFDAERCGIILRSIGYSSEKYVVNAFYEKTLVSDTVRDEESLPMLQLIRETRVYDLGYFYQPANINKELIYLFRAENSNWISRYNALEKSAKTILGRFNDAFTKLKDDVWS